MTTHDGDLFRYAGIPINVFLVRKIFMLRKFINIPTFDKYSFLLAISCILFSCHFICKLIFGFSLICEVFVFFSLLKS